MSTAAFCGEIDETTIAAGGPGVVTSPDAAVDAIADTLLAYGQAAGVYWLDDTL